MTPEDILSRPANVLDQQAREAYFRDGFVLLPGFLDRERVARLREVTAEFVEASRNVTASDAMFDLEPGHGPASPRLRRLSFPVDHHEAYRELAFEGAIVDVAEDLLGPNVVYHHSKLNFKWSGGGEAVKWHQDIQFWPHTDYSPLTIGIYLEDVDTDMAPMGVVPGSHRGPLFDLADERGEWVGCIGERDLPRAQPERAVYLEGPAGSVTVHNCCAVHGSAPNDSDRVRPLLLQTYYAGDAWPLMGVGTNGLGAYANTVVRGQRPERFDVAGRSVPTAPDWSKGYISIFDVQDDAAPDARTGGAGR